MKKIFFHILLLAASVVSVFAASNNFRESVVINGVQTMLVRGDMFSAHASGGTAPYKWFSSDTNVVTVDSLSGVGKAKQRGSADLRVFDANGNDGVITLTVFDLRAGFKDTTLYSLDTVTIPFFVSSMDNLGIVSHQLQISYPSSNLQYIDVVKEGTLSSEADIQANNIAGSLTVAIAQGNDFSGSGVLFKIRFKPLVFSSVSWLNTLNYNVNEPGPNTPIVLTSSGNIFIQQKPNTPPFFVSAPNDTVINENDSLSVQFTAIDNDGDAVRYYFAPTSVIPFGAYLDTLSGRLSWRPSYFQQGSYLFRIGVKDTAGAHGSPKDFLVIVKNVNRPPKIQNVFPDTFFVNVLNTLSFTIMASDPDNDQIFFSTIGAPSGSTINSFTGNFSWTPTTAQAGFYQFQITASDTTGGIDTKTIKVLVIKPNSPPVFVLAPRDTTISENQLLQMQILATDVDNDSLTYGISNAPPGMSIHSKTGLITWIPTFTESGLYSITVSVTDGKSSPVSGSMMINVLNVNRPPVFTSVLPDTVIIFDTMKVEFTYKAFDPDNDNFTFSLVNIVPNGSITPSGNFVFMPAPKSSGVFPVVVKVSDGTAFALDTAVIVVLQSNGAPLFTKTLPDTVIAANKEFQFNYEAIDPDGDTLTFVKIFAPPGVQVSLSGLLTWTPMEAQLGTFPIVVAVTDGKGGALDTAFVTVIKRNNPPYFTSVLPDTTIAEQQQLQFTYKAVDPEDDQLTFSAVEIPESATLSSNGIFNWTPTSTQVGNHRIIVKVDDGKNLFVLDTAVVAVLKVNKPPVFTNVLPDTTIAENQPLTFTYQAVDPENETIAFRLLSEIAGMNITENGTLTWLPTFEQAGQYKVIVEARDSRNTISHTTNVIVTNVNRVPRFVSVLPDTTLLVDTTLVFTYSAVDDDNDVLSYALIKSPSGAALNSTGRFSWKARAQDMGRDTIIVRVSDGQANVLDTAVVTVLGYSVARITKTEIEYGTINFGDSRRVTLSITNVGYIPLVLQLVQPANVSEHFKTDSARYTIPAGVQYELGFIYAPKNVGVHSTQLFFTTNDANRPEILFTLSGTAVTTAPVVKKVLVDLVHKPKTDLRDSVQGIVPFITALKQSGISVTFAETTFAPSGFDIVLIQQPQKNFTQQEAEALGTFVTNGGTALLLGDANDKQTATVLNLLAQQALKDTVGLRLDTTLVVDTVHNIQKNSSALLLTAFTDKKHPMLKGIDTLAFFGSASIQTFGRAVPFLRASQSSYVEEFPETKAPAVIGLRNAGKGKFMMFGDADLWKNLLAYHNLPFAFNIFTVTENYEVKMPEPTPNEEYRIVSIPYDLNDNAIASVLKNLGEPGPYNWRLYGRWNTQKGSYLEYPFAGFSEFKRGEGYWLITRGSKTINPGSATIIPSQEFFPIKIAPGYNLIGNPFPYRVSWESSIHDSTENILWKYNGKGFDSVSTIMEPFTGYFVKSVAKESTIIYINPFIASGSKQEKLSVPVFAKNEWRVNISATDGKINDAINFAGVSSIASDEWDAMDISEPPPSPTDFLVLAFNRKLWKHNPGLYAADIRPLTENGNSWDFTVTSAKKGARVQLQLQTLGNLPAEFNVYLVDMRNERVLYSNEFSEYTFTMSSNETQRTFRLVVGKKEFVEQNTNGIPLTPKEFSLEQNYPNPFNPSTTIRYTLGHSAEVTIIIYNVLGQVVRTLVSEQNAIGTYEAEWDGKNDKGMLVSSGIYFYTITAKSNNEILFTKTQRMALVK